MSFPIVRLSRLRANEVLRSMVRETSLAVTDLIAPVFVHHADNVRNPIASMPGAFQLSVENAAEYAKQLFDLGIRSVLLFGIPAQKDPVGSDTWDDNNGVIQRALRALKQAAPDMLLITDVCFCEYTDHGHCGVLTERNGEKVIDHDATLENLALQVASHAKAGADMVAPSGMIDGAVGAIREALDGTGYSHIPMAPSATPPKVLPNSATAAVTRWTSLTPEKPYERSNSISPRAPISSWSNQR